MADLSTKRIIKYIDDQIGQLIEQAITPGVEPTITEYLRGQIAAYRQAREAVQTITKQDNQQAAY
jgi:hypothetical protein